MFPLCTNILFLQEKKIEILGFNPGGREGNGANIMNKMFVCEVNPQSFILFTPKQRNSGQREGMEIF